MKQVIRIEMDDNTLRAVRLVVDSVNRENSRTSNTRSPGKELRKAFGINITKIIKEKYCEKDE